MRSTAPFFDGPTVWTRNENRWRRPIQIAAAGSADGSTSLWTFHARNSGRKAVRIAVPYTVLCLACAEAEVFTAFERKNLKWIFRKMHFGLRGAWFRMELLA